MTPDEKFQANLTDPRTIDTRDQLPLLRRYASGARRICEIGVDDGTTTLAFLLGRPESLHSYDLWRQPEITQIEAWAKELGVDFQFQEGDSREITIPNVDLLFLDTDHVPKTLLIELEKHSPMVQDTILLHDTTACGDYACNPDDYNGPWIKPGLWDAAIAPFLRSELGRAWRINWVHLEGTGLTCLVRR